MAQLLRYRIDLIAVLTVLSAVGLQVLAVVFAWPWFWVLPILLLVRQASIVQHNHAHLRVFHSRFLNELFGRLCALSNGVLPEFYELHHVRNHHPFNQNAQGQNQDWSSLFAFRGARFPDRPVSRAYYVATFPLIAYSHCAIEMARQPGSPIFKRFLITLGISIPSLGWLAWLNAWQFLIFFAVPWTVIAFGLGYNNYNSHQGCGYQHRYDIALDDLALPFRFLGYNQGFHLEHHLKPGMHWSLLPAYHRDILDKIPRRNIRPRLESAPPGPEKERPALDTPAQS